MLCLIADFTAAFVFLSRTVATTDLWAIIQSETRSIVNASNQSIRSQPILWMLATFALVLGFGSVFYLCCVRFGTFKRRTLNINSNRPALGLDDPERKLQASHA